MVLINLSHINHPPEEIFRLSAFRPPSVIFCILGAASISLAIKNLVVTRQAYFNDPATNKAIMVWYNCSQTGESLIAPNNMLRSNALWFFEAIVLVCGLWVRSVFWIKGKGLT